MSRPAPHHPHPRESPQRCSLRAQLRGDQMVGTAFPAARLLLVEQPGPWGRRGLRDSRMDRTVADTVEARAAAAGVRVQAIRRPGRTPLGTPRRWALVDTRDGVESIRWHSFTDDAELLDTVLVGDAADAGEPDDTPLYLVCAHSKHDTCCALRGRPVSAAIEALRPGRVWESSHLGGDRFAANVLVLPSGLLYGRVLPFAAPEFVAAAEADEVVPALLRGRIGTPSPAQAALAFAYEHLALRRRSDLRVESTTADGGTATVVLLGPHGRLRAIVAAERVEVVGLSCSKPGPGSYVSQRVLTLEALED